MANRKAIVTKEYGEVGFGSAKRDGEFFEVVFFFVKGDKETRQDAKVFLQQERAEQAAQAFRDGKFTISEYGGVKV